ncbi:MAG: ferritin-like domain-containing protein [Acidobacteria bacterium]|nr:ferritin-like domain-containing protein [Acidobacteriota bacterium]
MSDALDSLLSEMQVYYTWNYKSVSSSLNSLYEKGKKEQWNSSQALDWKLDVDPENLEKFPETSAILYGSDIWQRMNKKEQTECVYENTAWRLSNFLHGEQGALLSTAQLVVCVPFIEAKFYGATQVMDEGRHVEVFHRYLHEKVGTDYPVNKDLKALLDLILKDGRWDLKYLGMQIIIEGLALASIRVLRSIYKEPLLDNLLRLIMQDEARHVAFGLISLGDFYKQLSENERREREDFAYEACILMRDRLDGREMWEKLGLPVKECIEHNNNSIIMREFRQILFSHIIPNLKKLNLLSERIRPRYEEMGVLVFENNLSSEQEIASSNVIN